MPKKSVNPKAALEATLPSVFFGLKDIFFYKKFNTKEFVLR